MYNYKNIRSIEFANGYEITNDKLHSFSKEFQVQKDQYPFITISKIQLELRFYY